MRTTQVKSFIFCVTMFLKILPCYTEPKFKHSVRLPLQKNIHHNSEYGEAMKESTLKENTPLDPIKQYFDQDKDKIIREQREDRKEDDWPDYLEKKERNSAYIENAIHKIRETVLSNAKYLRKIDVLETRARNIDYEVHSINDALTKSFEQMSKQFQMQNWQEKNIINELQRVRTEITQVKQVLGHVLPMNKDIDVENNAGYNQKCESKLSNVEYILKLLTDSVEQILNTMLEVKNRSTLRSNRKSDPIKGQPAVAQESLTTLVSEFKRALREKNKRCDCSKVGRSGDNFPTDCYEIQSLGFNISGIYKIKPEDSEPFYVLCDMSTGGGGWTVFQNRYDGTQDFYRSWSEYKYGFGNLAGEFWLGLEKLHYLTNQKLYELRVELESHTQEEVHAMYTVFSIGPEEEGYRISTIGSYHGNAGDSLTYHSGQKFSTFDSDNDDWKDGICAVEHGGAWWYRECDKSNLNGKYIVNNDDISKAQGVYWNTFKGPTNYLSKTRMMIRPLPVSHTVSTSSATNPIVKSKTPLKGYKFEDLTRRIPNIMVPEIKDNTIPFIPPEDTGVEHAPRKWSPSYDDSESELRFIKHEFYNNTV